MTMKSRKTKWALFFTGLLNEPLVGLIAILPYILRKDLQASAFQISIFTMLKPVVALVSFYWGATLWRNRNRLRSNWMVSRFLASVPFLIFPFVQNSWFFIIGAALFQCFQRGGMPAQMEILKQNVPSGAREGFFSWSSAINCLGGVLIGVFLSFCINDHDWKILFLLSAGFGLLALVLQLVLQARVPIDSFQVSEPPAKRNPLRGCKEINFRICEEKNGSDFDDFSAADVRVHLCKEKSSKDESIFPSETLKVIFLRPLITPWKDSWNLLRERPDFARFQLGFMMGGIGLMLIMPALVLYSADELAISHVDMTISRFIWMGIGFVLATAFWRKRIALQGIYQLTGLVCLLFALCALCWILAAWSTVWFFVAFFLYGVAQAGSHLIWHLSGPLFAGSGDSSLFSTVNILTVGLRGLIVPLMASLLCVWIGPLFVIALGLVWCLAGSIYLLAQKEEKNVENTVI